MAKALEVDSAAKCAEKERKARNGEKRSKDKNVAVAVASSTAVPSTSAAIPITSSSAPFIGLDKTLTPFIQPLPTRGLSSIEYQVCKSSK